MRKVFDGNYNKLSDDVSFQILRTNPRLTTNTKLLYDGDKMYMESYDANELMATTKFKHKRIWKSGLYNNDIKNFLNGAGADAYGVGRKMKDTIIGNGDYAYQFENMYWCGAEEISSKLYNEEFGVIAPIYLKKQLPNYFVIFKVDGPSNSSDIEHDASDDNGFNNIINKCKIIKTFSLKQGTPIGDYLRKYTSQLSFDYDRAIYVNYSSNDIYYYGIDVNTGLLTRKVENFKDSLSLTDSTIIHDDDYITNGFYRNNLIYPYIINLEFLFDDNETRDYTFCRYFGMYCNDIDLYKIEDINSEMFAINKNYIYYAKDKYDELHTLNKYVSFDVPVGWGDIRNYYSLIDTDYPDVSKLSSMSELYGCFNKDNTEDEYSYEFSVSPNKNTMSLSNIDDTDAVGFNDYTIIKEVIDSDNSDNIDGKEEKQYLENAYVAMIKKPNGMDCCENATDKRSLCISDKKVSEDVFTGYCVKSVNAYCNYYDGVGYATYMFKLNKELSHGETISLKVDNNPYTFIAEEFIQKQVEEINASSSSSLISYMYNNAYKKLTGIFNKLSDKEKYLKCYIDYGSVYSTEHFIKSKDGDKGDNGVIRLYDYDDINIPYPYNTDSKVFKSYKDDSVNKYVKLGDDIDNKSILIFVEKENKSGNIISNRFSCTGGLSKSVETLANCINSNSHVPFTAKNVSNTLVIKYRSSGSVYNNRCRIEFSSSIENNSKVEKYSLNGDYFSGGTDQDGCLFTIYSDDITKFIGETDENGQLKERYIRTFGDNENAKITSYSYMIDDDGDIDTDYYLIATDDNGLNVRISDVKQVEILDKFYPYVGMLSFFPVMDFDFDTLYSPYCDNGQFKKEVEEFAIDYLMGLDDEDLDSEFDLDLNDNEIYTRYQLLVNNLSVDRLYNSSGSALTSEYDYYNENILSSLCTVSKTVPYIAKWGYVDGLDSCENPYRLNCNKVFGVDNFSANLFLIDGSILNYTHSMPYYIYDDFTKETDDDEVEKLDSTNEYQYIYWANSKKTSYVDCVDYWKELFENEDENIFDEIFETKENSCKRNKRNNKKYSRFKYGTSKRNSDTLFRGVKFEIVNLVKGNNAYKETFTTKYNDYKFSFLMIPVSNPNTLYFSNKVYFVKNDKFKFIVGFVVCNMFDKLTFNKSYVYGACTGLISGYNVSDKISGLTIDNKNIKYEIEYGDETKVIGENEYTGVLKDINDKKTSTTISEVNEGNPISIINAENGLFVYRYCYLNMNFEDAFSYESYGNTTIFLNKLKIKSPIIRTIIRNLYKTFESCEVGEIKITTQYNDLSQYNDSSTEDCSQSTYVIFNGNDMTFDENYEFIYIDNKFKGDRIIKDTDNEKINIKFEFVVKIQSSKYKKYYNDIDKQITAQTKDIKTAIYGDIYDMFNTVSAYNIKENVNNGYNVEYNSKDFKIKIIEPASVYSYDFFEGSISTLDIDNNKVIKSADITVKNKTEDVAIKILNRYSGYYQPIFKDIIIYDDMEVAKPYSPSEKMTYKFSNATFDFDYSDNYGSFGIINNMFFHKVSDNSNLITKSETPYYPLTGDYALDYRDYNIFSSNWDYNYYTRQKDAYTSETLDYMACIENGLCMFGSKYMNIPQTINIGFLKYAEEWNDDYLNDNAGINSEVMYREVNSEKVEFGLFIRNRIIRYFCELTAINTEFDKWIEQEKNKDYGIKGYLGDDIKDYVERNILKLYEISSIKMYVLQVKRGVNDTDIENNYERYFETDTWTVKRLEKIGFKEITSFTMNDICSNDFDKKITYTLESGMQEYFIFKIEITKK